MSQSRGYNIESLEKQFMVLKKVIQNTGCQRKILTKFLK